MRWLHFSIGGRAAYGIVEGDTVKEVSGNPILGEWAPTAKTHRLADITYEVPIIPRTFYAAGLNYAEHVIEMAKKRGEEPNLPKNPDMGYRAQNALIAHKENVIIPADAGELIHYEGELVVVIGRKAKHLTPENALECVFGYTIGNDVSERTWQRNDRTFWRGKNTDTFKPMGPWIETDLKLDDNLVTTVHVNGQESLRYHTNRMIFGVVTFLVAMTKYLTVYPGDVMWMGTDGTSPNLKHGDRVDVTITGIGTLSNTFIKEGM
jgi:2-keto-4-pentenoate hydratase/2-oxohepta-3-ene-1,7-dioic acid hydratase in catechol pathway